MVGVGERPRFEAAVAEGGGKLAGEAVEGKHAGGLHEFDEAQEVRVVGVIGEGESGVALVTMDRARIEGPTGDHGGAAGGDFF